MTPFFIFIGIVLISTFLRGLERSKKQKKIVRPTVKPQEPTVRIPERASLKKSDRKMPISKGTSVVNQKASHSKTGVKITRESVLNGIIMAEVLSPPKCKRR